MKKQLLTLVFLIILTGAYAQNVGIGTTTPNSSALLDLNSTTKGLLLPRLNTTQMFGIQNPASGLVVFNTNYNELYHYNGTNWRSIINSTYWIRPLTSRDVMGNSTDSVGIGVLVPTQRLDVNGATRVRGTLMADGDVVMDNATAIIQLKASGENKGFIQLNGNDLRMGTNSGNDNGKFVIRTNGADRVSVTEDGDLNITGKITSDNTGSAPLTPLCWGRTNTLNGGIRTGTANTSVQRLGEGYYRLTCPGINENSCIIITGGATGVSIGHIAYDGYVDVYIRRTDVTNVNIDQVFYFIIY